MSLIGMVSRDCFSDIDECASDPCFNGGTCSDLVNSFVCNCPPGYGGVLCDAGMSTVVNYTVFIYFLPTSNHIIFCQQFLVVIAFHVCVSLIKDLT